MLRSEEGVDYTKLSELLEQRKWKGANQETADKLLLASRRESWWNMNLEEIPCQDLQIVDELWINYSCKKFGFSIQKKIWDNLNQSYSKFEEYVRGEGRGWHCIFGENNRPGLQLTFALSAPDGHLPYIWLDLSSFSHTYPGGLPPMAAGPWWENLFLFHYWENAFLKRLSECNF